MVQGQIIYKNVTLNKNCETTILRDERIKRVWGREGMFTLESGVIKELYVIGRNIKDFSKHFFRIFISLILTTMSFLIVILITIKIDSIIIL